MALQRAVTLEEVRKGGASRWGQPSKALQFGILRPYKCEVVGVGCSKTLLCTLNKKVRVHISVWASVYVYQRA